MGVIGILSGGGFGVGNVDVVVGADGFFVGADKRVSNGLGGVGG
ncbi:hypothetical protein AGMMS50233_10920 [Endomicrobiia bacterium]|nr:hypothetical protein AGMMS50233_10920 [Endomicrobiia bacterium]